MKNSHPQGYHDYGTNKQNSRGENRHLVLRFSTDPRKMGFAVFSERPGISLDVCKSKKACCGRTLWNTPAVFVCVSHYVKLTFSAEKFLKYTFSPTYRAVHVSIPSF